MIPPISMLKIQELSGAMPLDSHRGSAPGSRGLRSAAIEVLPPPQVPPLDPALVAAAVAEYTFLSCSLLTDCTQFIPDLLFHMCTFWIMFSYVKLMFLSSV